MPFQPVVNLELVIDDIAYRVAEHPAAPGLPYGQEGRQATVYQLVLGSERRALKVFKPRYQVPAQVNLASRLSVFADLPGLAVCRRTVLTARRHTTLLTANPDLTYAVLMPWIAGPTWMEVLIREQALTPDQSLLLARALAETLASMEEQGIAHCDLSGPNLLLPALDHGPRRPASVPLALVDVEQMYGPGLDRPPSLPGGSPGYAHRSAGSGLWRPEADRFAGGLLLAEMLGWCDARVRRAAWGESYFDPAEVQQPTARYQELSAALRERWGVPIAGLLAGAWDSATLDECPTFGHWLLALPSVGTPAHVMAPGFSLTAPTPEPHSRAEVPGRAVSVQAWTDQAQVAEQGGDLTGALHAYREAQMLVPAESGLAHELALIVRDLETRRAAIAPQLDSASAADLATLFDAGQLAYGQGDWTRAKELLREVVRRQPDYRRGAQQAARLLAAADRHPERPISGARRPGVWLAGAAVLLLLLLVGGSLLAVAAGVRSDPNLLSTSPTPVQTPAPPAATGTAAPTSAATNTVQAASIATVQAVLTETAPARTASQGGVATITARAQLTGSAQAAATGTRQVQLTSLVAAATGTAVRQARETATVRAHGPTVAAYPADRATVRILWSSQPTPRPGEFRGLDQVAVDADGNVYVTDSGDCLIQKFGARGDFLGRWGTCGDGPGAFVQLEGITVAPDGKVFVTDKGQPSTTTGRVEVFTADGRFITQWGKLDRPSGVAVDANGNVFVIEQGADQITRFAENGAQRASWGSNGTGAGQFDFRDGLPSGLATDTQGNLYVPDMANNRIEKFTADGTFVTQWGQEGANPGQFSWPVGVAIGKDGNLDVLDSANYRVQVFTPDGAAVGLWGQQGNDPGQFQPTGYGDDGPPGIAVSSVTGLVYVTDGAAEQIKAFQSDGTFVQGWGGRALAGAGDFSFPEDVAVTADDTLLVADTGNQRIEALTAEGGFSNVLYQGAYIAGLDHDGAGNIYAFDGNERRVLKLAPTGALLAQWGQAATPADNEVAADGSFNARCAGPADLAVSRDGMIFVADTCDARIQAFNDAGQFLTKWGTKGDHPSQFFAPVGIGADAAGDVYISDYNYRVQEFTRAGKLITSWGTQGSGTGQFGTPSKIAVDSRGRVYVLDGGNDRIQVFTASGQFIATWGGKGTAAGMFLQPAGIAIDSADQIYVADSRQNRITKFAIDLH